MYDSSCGAGGVGVSVAVFNVGKESRNAVAFNETSCPLYISSVFPTVGAIRLAF